MLNYVQRVFVGDSDGLANTGTTLATITRGDILVLNEDMTPLANGAAKQPFYVALGTGYAESPFILSSKINPDNASFAIKDTRAAADGQATIAVPTPAIGDTAEVIVAFEDRQRLIANKQSRFVMGAEATSTAPIDLADALAAQASFSSPYSDPYGIVVDVTATVGTPSVVETGNDITLTKGSKLVTFSVAAQHGTDVAFAAGDLIDILGSIYIIESATATTITLTRPYTGASQVYASAGGGVDYATTVSNVAIRVTGVASPYNNPEIDIYEKPVFSLGGSLKSAATGLKSNFGAVTVVSETDLGQGIDKQIKRMEFDVQSYLGNANLRQWPIPSFDYHTVDGVSYDVVNIIAQDEHEGDLQNQMKSPIGLTLAFAFAGLSAQRDAVFEILEDVMGRAGELIFTNTHA